MKCQFEINCEKSDSKSNLSIWECRLSGGSERDSGEGIGRNWGGRMGQGKKTHSLEREGGGGFQNIF